MPPVERHFLRRRVLGVPVRVPQFDRRVDVKDAAVMAPLEDFATVNVPGQVNQEVAGRQIFAQQRAQVVTRHALAGELHAALQPRRQHTAAVFEIHDGDVGTRGLEVFDQDGEGALRHGPVTDEQNFVFKFQHGKNILARHFVRIFFALQEFIDKRTRRCRIRFAEPVWLAAVTCRQSDSRNFPAGWRLRKCCGLGQAAPPATALRSLRAPFWTSPTD